MQTRFGSVFGSTLDERIREALAHKSAKKYTDLQAYVTGWLRRDFERLTPSSNVPRTKPIETMEERRARRMAEREKINEGLGRNEPRQDQG